MLYYRWTAANSGGEKKTLDLKGECKYKTNAAGGKRTNKRGIFNENSLDFSAIDYI